MKLKDFILKGRYSIPNKLILKEIFQIQLHKYKIKMAGQEGIEPPTYGFGDRRSTN